MLVRTGEETWTDTFQFGVSFVPLQGDCVNTHCAGGDLPVCPAQRFAVENHAWDYLHANVVCSVDPCSVSGHNTSYAAVAPVTDPASFDRLLVVTGEWTTVSYCAGVVPLTFD